MIIRSTILTILATIPFTSAFAGSSLQHSAQSVDHSGRAASHASAAAVSAAATVIAVPVIAFGSALSISGGALVDIGASTPEEATTHRVMTPRVEANDAPRLD